MLYGFPPSKKYLYLEHKHSQWPFETFPIPSLKLLHLFCSRHVTAWNAIRKCSRSKCQLCKRIFIRPITLSEWEKEQGFFQKPISLKWVSPNSSCTHSAMWNKGVSHERSDMFPAYKYHQPIGAFSWLLEAQENIFPTTKNPALYFLWILHKTKQAWTSVCSEQVQSKTSVKHTEKKPL